MAKIMLVEDDANLQSIYGDRLTAEGHSIISARDGEEALSLAMKEKPDLIISDIMMPKISGFDMLDILRTTPETKDIKIIMMTALSQAEDKERADKLGADKYLVKSQVTLDDVARVVNEVINEAPRASDSTEGVAPAAPQLTPSAPVSEPTIVNDAPVVAAPAVVPAADPVPDLAPTPDPVAPTLNLPANDPPVQQDLPVTSTPSVPPAAEPLQTDPVSDKPAEEAVVAADSVPSAEEQAVISSQIDEFLAKNLPDTPTHTADGGVPATNIPTPTATEETVPSTPAPQEAPEAASMDDIIPPPVISSTPPAAELPAKETPSEPVSDMPATEPNISEPVATETPKKTLGERTIQPLSDPEAPAKPNIMDLYDKEVAKEITDSPVPTPPSGAMIGNETQAAPAENSATPITVTSGEKPPAPTDPHAIAL